MKILIAQDDPALPAFARQVVITTSVSLLTFTNVYSQLA